MNEEDKGSDHEESSNIKENDLSEQPIENDDNVTAEDLSPSHQAPEHVF